MSAVEASASPVSQDELRTILDSLPAMVGYWDRDLRNHIANKAYLEFFGMAPDEIRGMHIRDVLGPELFAANHPYMVRALAGEEQVFERAIPDPAGVVRYTQASYIPDRVDGTVRGFVALVTDVTTRELALRQVRQLLDAAPDAIVGVSAEGRIVVSNEQTERLFGYEGSELHGLPVEMLMPERFRERHVDLRADYSADPRRRSMGAGLTLHARRKDGTEFPVEISLGPLETEQGRVVVSAVRDITDRVRAEQDSLRLAAIVESSHDAIISKDLEGVITSWNAGAERLYGYAAAEILGKSMSVLTLPGRTDEVAEILSRVVAGETVDDEEVVRVCKDGTLVDVSLTVSAIRDRSGEVIGASAIARDIGTRLRYQERLLFLSEHDALTGALNRRRFERDLSEQVKRARRYNEKGALLVIDVNRFKEINDTYGHQTGDKALQAIAGLLRERARDTDVVARLGGDEFAVLVPHADLEHAAALAEDLKRLVRECRIQTGDESSVHLSVSIGIAQIDQTTASDDAALIEADAAMYAEKRQRSGAQERDGADVVSSTRARPPADEHR